MGREQVITAEQIQSVDDVLVDHFEPDKIVFLYEHRGERSACQSL